jgi:hypothetical protein
LREDTGVDLAGRRALPGRAGRLFGRVGDNPPALPPTPIIDDRRAASAGLSIGARLNSQDVDAATRLASLVPGDVGSAATRLRVLVTDENGFVVRADPQGWSAIFGFYTPSLRTPELIPGQVRLLRSLLIGRSTDRRVVLASETDGTYVPGRPEAQPVAEPNAMIGRLGACAPVVRGLPRSRRVRVGLPRSRMVE